MPIHPIYIGQIAIAHCLTLRALGTGVPATTDSGMLARRRFRRTFLLHGHKRPSVAQRAAR
jgi:hypothetical protein